MKDVKTFPQIKKNKTKPEGGVDEQSEGGGNREATTNKP